MSQWNMYDTLSEGKHNDNKATIRVFAIKKTKFTLNVLPKELIWLKLTKSGRNFPNE